MTIKEMISQLKAAGYSVIRTDRLSTLYTQFVVDHFDIELRKDMEGFLEYNQKDACSAIGRKLAEELFSELEFKKVRGYPDDLYDTYRTEVTIVMPRSEADT